MKWLRTFLSRELAQFSSSFLSAVSIAPTFILFFAVMFKLPRPRIALGKRLPGFRLEGAP